MDEQRQGDTLMSLDGDQIARLTIEATMGQEQPSIPGDEALAFFEQVKKDAEKIKREGGILDIPNN